ncbi:phospho-N-acetylmuramoyl-pentapeptide-transferase [endosymbiont of Pachyrhynchus infernalis]|uniref:phospho-N-acetylmuramoyl-pentapeptide- transferase n=1 Tax=endosymbiont of Pachyrhynchus infernalis TaxID=1971488 RepID=UPI001E28962C|nr:phospho-N-acetylmuramoyl-pentapeptide-transferase [endosymbiont of Pachyrhynchus infernalis]
MYLFKKFNLKQKNRLNSFHVEKCNTFTMGGLIILLSSLLSIILWSDIYNIYTLYFIIFLISYGIIGFIDDYIKIYNKYYCGFKILEKYFIQSILTLILILFLYKTENILFIDRIFIPFLKKKNIYINKFIYFLLRYFTLMGAINSVNITDGLDGLAIISIILSLSTSIIISIIYSNEILSNIFNTLYIKNAYEIINLSSAIIGSSLGFLWFNSYPSYIFMGDTGSLSLGGILGLIFILLNSELLLILSGGIFVIELLSIILQIISYKIFKKRIYLMAPIHHHYEIKGVHESKIVFRFSIISFIFNLLCLLIIFIRK